MRTKTWQIAEKETDDLKTQLLFNRGLKTKEEQELFLHPPKPTLAHISKYSQVDKEQYKRAVDRIMKAIIKQEKIIVYGDYDVDGITGTTILWETIYYLGGNCTPYIPDRESEGYGLNKNAIQKLATDKISLIITVDCGITNVKEVEEANSLEVDVVITDHHQKGETLPDAYAVFYDDTLVGVSVAWLLAEGLIKESKNSTKITPRMTLELNQNWDLVALGTIADLQPLLGKNRSFVYWGLKEINSTKRLGLKRLIERAQLSLGEIDTYHVGYVLAPRINASGRLHDALQAVRLLCTRNEVEALEFADAISKLNVQRQELTFSSFEEAELQVEKNKDQKLLVLSHESWHEGIVGLVASRIKEKHYRPTIAISVQDKIGKGSARSIAGFNIIEAIREVEEYLISCGGHPMAAGFSINTTNIQIFKEKLQEIALRDITDEMMVDTLIIDLTISLQDITDEFITIVEMFRPFGIGNSEPLFLSNNLTIMEIRKIGKEKNHLKLKLAEGKIIFDVLAFGQGERFSELREGMKIDIVFSVFENEWNGLKSINLKAKDFKIVE